MHEPPGVRTSTDYPIPAQMKAWVLGGADELFLRDKPVPMPGRAEVLVRIDAGLFPRSHMEPAFHRRCHRGITEPGLPFFPSGRWNLSRNGRSGSSTSS